MKNKYTAELIFISGEKKVLYESNFRRLLKAIKSEGTLISYVISDKDGWVEKLTRSFVSNYYAPELRPGTTWRHA